MQRVGLMKSAPLPLEFCGGRTQGPPPARSESREIAELRRLKQEQPDLGSAADLQVELLQLQRRVQSRVSLPAIRLDKDYLNGLLASAPVLKFEHIPIEWGDLRFLLRATAAAMRSHEALDETDFRRIETLCRDSERLPGSAFVVRIDDPDARRPICRGCGRARTGDPAGDAAVPHALGRRDHGQDRSRRLDPRHLSALRRRTGLRGDHAGGRPDPDLRPLLGALALPSDHLPVLRQRRPRAGSRRSRAGTGSTGSMRAMCVKGI